MEEITIIELPKLEDGVVMCNANTAKALVANILGAAAEQELEEHMHE